MQLETKKLRGRIAFHFYQVGAYARDGIGMLLYVFTDASSKGFLKCVVKLKKIMRKE